MEHTPFSLSGELYAYKLAEGGIIAFHISNRYLTLQPLLASIAANTDPKLVARYWNDIDRNSSIGKEASQWVILARAEADFGPLARDGRWKTLRAPGSMRGSAGGASDDKLVHFSPLAPDNSPARMTPRKPSHGLTIR